MGRYIIALFLEVILLTLSFQTGESIKCYMCNSQNEPKCADPMEKNGLEPTECTRNVFSEASDQIRKGVQNLMSNMFGVDTTIPDGTNPKFACQKMDISDGSGNKITMRSCGLAKTDSVDPCTIQDEFIKKSTNGKGKVDFCGTCEDDLCNDSSRHSFTTMLYLMVPCFAVILSRWMVV